MFTKLYFKIFHFVTNFRQTKNTKQDSLLEDLPQDIFLVILSKLGKDIGRVPQLNKNLKSKVYDAIPLPISPKAINDTKAATYFDLLRQFNLSNYTTMLQCIEKLEKEQKYYRRDRGYSWASHIQMRSAYEYSVQAYWFSLIAATLFSMGAGAYVGSISKEFFNSHFIGVEHGVITGVFSFFCGERISCSLGKMMHEYNRNKISDIDTQLNNLRMNKLVKPAALLKLESISEFQRDVPKIKR